MAEAATLPSQADKPKPPGELSAVPPPERVSWADVQDDPDLAPSQTFPKPTAESGEQGKERAAASPAAAAEKPNPPDSEESGAQAAPVMKQGAADSSGAPAANGRASPGAEEPGSGGKAAAASESVPPVGEDAGLGSKAAAASESVPPGGEDAGLGDRAADVSGSVPPGGEDVGSDSKAATLKEGVPPSEEELDSGNHKAAAEDSLPQRADELDLGGIQLTERAPAAPPAGVADSEGTADKPEAGIRAQQLDEAPETRIMTVLTEEQTPYTSAARFEDLDLSKPLLMGLYTSMKFEKPSKVQAQTLPMILQPPHRNLIAQAHNGSGKTTCFVLGMLSRVDPARPEPQAICVCPTRELVIQNEAVCLKMGCFTGITVASTAAVAAAATSRRGRVVDQIVIGTPGTLKRWMTRDRILSAAGIRILVFDEADHMLDQDGFQDDSVRMLRDIKKATNNRCQVLLFSATFSDRVKAFAQAQVRPANEVYVPREALSLDVIKQYQVKCPSRAAKAAVLKDRIFPAAEKLGQSIIFVRTREAARELHMQLMADGHRCTSIQGGMPHEERDLVIQEFRSGTTKILISTDVLARGFDQAQVTLVVNYDIPVKANRQAEPEYETYLHRIGRSGRFGRKGAAFNLVCGQQDELLLSKIARHFDREIPEVPWDDDDAFEEVLKSAGLA